MEDYRPEILTALVNKSAEEKKRKRSTEDAAFIQRFKTEIWNSMKERAAAGETEYEIMFDDNIKAQHADELLKGMGWTTERDHKKWECDACCYCRSLVIKWPAE